MSRRVCVVGVLLAMHACAPFDSPVDPAGGAPDALVAEPSFSADVEPILVKRCSIGGCHSFAAAQGGLVLTEGEGYDQLVGVTSVQKPAMLRVRPFRTDSSWLAVLILPDAQARGGYPRMPLSSLPLTSNQIGTIMNWIMQGAPRN